MSDPTPPGEAASLRRAAPAHRPPAESTPASSRWLDRLSVLLVCASVAGATAAATPPILRSTGVVTPPPVAMPPPPSAARPSAPPPNLPPGTTYGVDENPRFLLDDAEPHVTELERLYPDGMWPGQQRAGRREGAAPAPASVPRAGHARTPLTVRERADVLAEVTGRVPVGGKITLLAERGEWALVAHRTAEGAAIVGWAARSAILIP